VKFSPKFCLQATYHDISITASKLRVMIVNTDPLSPSQEQLNTFLPSFYIQSSQIQILKDQGDFLPSLDLQDSKCKIKSFHLYLYIGNRKQELVHTLDKNKKTLQLF
jgi:hypothetical protein